MIHPSPAVGTLRGTDGIRRAWPAADGSLTVELHRGAGLRAGRISPDGEMTLSPPRTDRKLPGLERLCGTLVVHRLHRRAVALQSDRAVKVVRPGRARHIATAASLMGEVCVHAGIGAAEVLAATDDHIESSLLGGATLHALGDAGIDGWRELAARWPYLALHRIDLPTHDAAAETAVLRSWLAHAQRFSSLGRLPELERAVEATAAELAARPDPAVTLHRDLHDKQVLWDGATLSLLDLDTAARGEAALDLANLKVHAELRHAQGTLTHPAEVYAALAPAIDHLRIRDQRLRAYTRASRLRLAFLYSFRPNSRPWLDTWVDHALTHERLE